MENKKPRKKIKKKTLLKVLIILIIGTIVFFAIRGCGTEEEAGNDTEQYGSAIVVTEDETAKPITLNSGDELVVELEENPATGYNWYYTVEDENIITFDSDEYREPETEEHQTGVSGKRLFRFRANEKGSTTVTFEYYRIWEGEIVKQHTFYIEVQ